MENVLITGVSAGIGNALAHRLLAEGARVWGVSRSMPSDLLDLKGFHHVSVDLSDCNAVQKVIRKWLVDDNQIDSLKYVFLNAGQFSQRIAELRNVSLDSIQSVMNVNVWANKLILDVLLNSGVTIETCIVSSSIAGVRARAGNSAYALSKATLNMLMQQYALENPEVYFAVLGLCNVHTYLSHQIATLPLEGDFEEIAKLRARCTASGYIVTAEERADHILWFLKRDFRNEIKSGEFTEIRRLLSTLVPAYPASTKVM